MVIVGRALQQAAERAGCYGRYNIQAMQTEMPQAR